MYPIYGYVDQKKYNQDQSHMYFLSTLFNLISQQIIICNIVTKMQIFLCFMFLINLHEKPLYSINC